MIFPGVSISQGIIFPGGKFAQLPFSGVGEWWFFSDIGNLFCLSEGYQIEKDSIPHAKDLWVR